MTRVTVSEQRLLDLIKAMPGSSYCPGIEAKATPEVNRLVRSLERKGLLNVEPTQDGPRFTVRESMYG